MMTVTPWEVSGKTDYEKLIKEFGTSHLAGQLLSRLKKYGPLHTMLERGFFFSHRDLDKVLDDHEKGKGFFLYTGRAPSKPMHLGHVLPFEITKWFQEAFGVNLYIQIPDEEKFLAGKVSSLKEIDAVCMDDIMHIAALGFSPDRTFIFRNREYAGKMYEAAVLVAKKTTFSTAKAVFGFDNSTNIGFSFYPAMQCVPAFFEKKRCLIPSAIDQDPYWRIQRDVAESLGYFKTAAVHGKFLPPLTGMEGKMSASEEQSAIYLNDDEKTVKEKILKYAFSGGQATVAEHRKLGGRTDVDVSYQWLSIFFEPDDRKLGKIHDDYETGKMLTSELKQILIEKINACLKHHNKKKQKAKQTAKKMMYSGKLAKKMWDWEIEK